MSPDPSPLPLRLEDEDYRGGRDEQHPEGPSVVKAIHANVMCFAVSPTNFFFKCGR